MNATVLPCKAVCALVSWSCNFSGEGTVSNDDDPGWTILERTREASADHGRRHESTAWKGPGTGPTDWEGAWGQPIRRQALEGDHGGSKNLVSNKILLPCFIYWVTSFYDYKAFFNKQRQERYNRRHFHQQYNKGWFGYLCVHVMWCLTPITVLLLSE